MAAELVDYACCKLARQRGLAGHRAGKDEGEAGGVRVLQQIAVRPRAERLEELVLVQPRREHHDRRGGDVFADRAHGGDPTPADPDGDQAEVRQLAPRGRDSRVGVLDLGAERESVAIEHAADAGAGRRMVVRDQHADGLARERHLDLPRCRPFGRRTEAPPRPMRLRRANAAGDRGRVR